MKLVPYQAPKWFLDHPLVQKHLTSVVSKIPSHRIELLSKRPTPIERVQPLTSPQYSVPAEYELSIKRDDLTHTEPHLQGNKLRKLEFVFADVLAKKAQNVLTAGGLQSNHCRTVASVCARLGLRSHLFLRSPYPDATQIDLNGNLLVDLMLGSKIYLIERVAQYYESIEAKMNILASKLDSPSYLIPIGASNIVGLWGYIEMFDELISIQKADELYDDICVTTGSGGTMSGLAIANYLSGSKFRLHAFCVCDSSAYFYSHLEDILKELFGSDDIPNPREIVDIIECSKGLGYGKSTDDELKFQIEFLKSNGIMLDPVYTGKMVYTAYNLLGGRKPTLEYDKESDFVKKLSGKRILLVHTGGHLANFEAKRFESVFKDRENFFDCFGEKIDLV